MKKHFLIIFSFFAAVLVNTPLVLAATPTPQDTDVTTTPGNDPTGEKLNQQINQLKDRIASRVAELNLVEKRGIIGTVDETSGTQISIKDMSGKTRFVDVDEITKFASPDQKTGFGLSDLKKGDQISALGLYNKQSQRVLGRFVGVTTTPTFIFGRISEIDNKNFTITVISEDQKETLVDNQSFTLISSYTPEDGIVKSGFSKLAVGDNVMVTGFYSEDDPKMFEPSRILDLAVLPVDPKIILPDSAEATSSAQSSARTTPRVTPQ